MTQPQNTEAEAQTPEERTVDQRLEAIEGVVFELIDKVEGLAKEQATLKKQAVTKPKGLFGGKRTPSPMKDLKTGIVYPSKAAVGKQFASEAGADPLNTMAYYTVTKVLKMPDGADRFVEASPEEGAKAREEYQKQVEAEVAEMNAKLEAEQAAAKAAAPAPKPQPQPQPKKK